MRLRSLSKRIERLEAAPVGDLQEGMMGRDSSALELNLLALEEILEQDHQEGGLRGNSYDTAVVLVVTVNNQV